MYQAGRNDNSETNNRHLSQFTQVESVQHDLDDFHLSTPSSFLNGRPGRKSPRPSTRKLSALKANGRRQSGEPNGICHLLNLPQDVLQALLARLPPKSLKSLSATCVTLKRELEDESIWRQAYVNRFLFEGATRTRAGREDVQVLVQPCNGEGLGWKREALTRESMINRWLSSKAAPVQHTPPVGLIHSLSLFYPPSQPLQAPPLPTLIVGKTHQTPTKPTSAPQSLTDSPNPSPGPDSSPSLSQPKLTHRQKYEALLAATTRPAPYILSAGLMVGGVVRSDPLNGKVSKGYWGPGNDANFHLQPQMDRNAPPSTVYLPSRDQSFVLWGHLNGSVTHTKILSKHSSSPGTRAASQNTHCDASERHDAEVLDMWAPDTTPDPVKFVSAGADGKVKFWRLHSVTTPARSGKKSPKSNIQSSIQCLFTSSVVLEPLANRSEVVKLRQTAIPDAVVLARCDVEHNVVCGITADGDLRLWFDAGTAHMKECRIDAGSEEEFGPVTHLSLDVEVADGHLTASALVFHRLCPSFTRFDVSRVDSEFKLDSKIYKTSTGGSLNVLKPFLRPSPPIAPLPAFPTVHENGLVPADDAQPTIEALKRSSPSADPEEDDKLFLPSEPVPRSPFGRFVVGADTDGMTYIWAWNDDQPAKSSSHPLRSWKAAKSKITAVDFACGLVATGSCDGFIRVFDPLTPEPTLLREFRASHLSAADALVAASEQFEARYYIPNQIVLDNDMLLTSLGRRIFAWRAGSGKGRQAGGKGEKRNASGRGEGKSNARTSDLRSLNADAADDQALMLADQEEEEERNRNSERAQRRQLAALDDLGLDGDEALQYALLLSMDDQGAGEPFESGFDPDGDWDESYT